MRVLAVVNLIFYFFLSIHAFPDGHMQVLCIGSHGHIALETLETAEVEQAQSQSCNLNRAHDPCPDCHDILLGDGHSDHTPLSQQISLDLSDLAGLQRVSPMLLEIPGAEKILPEIAPSQTLFPPPIHTASTVLLI
jgi:hypothetical protein